MLTAIVSKKSVSYGQPKLHNITFNLVLKEDTVEVLNRDIQIQFLAGDSISSKVALVTGLMQDEIDKYKSEKVIFDSSQLNTAVTNIQNGLVL